MAVRLPDRGEFASEVIDLPTTMYGLVTEGGLYEFVMKHEHVGIWKAGSYGFAVFWTALRSPTAALYFDTVGEAQGFIESMLSGGEML